MKEFFSQFMFTLRMAGCFVLLIVCAAAIQNFSPEVVEYLYGDDVEKGGMGLEIFAIPSILALILGFMTKLGTNKYSILVFGLAMPIVFIISIWLWELLGLALLAICFLFAILGYMNEVEAAYYSDNVVLRGWPIVIAILYLIMRIAGANILGGHVGVLDLAFMVVFIALTLIFEWITNEKDDEVSTVFLGLVLVVTCFVCIQIFSDRNFMPRPSRQTAAQIMEQNAESYVCTAKSLNVRTSPSANGYVLGKLNKGDVINVYSIDDDFAEISYQGTKCYVSSKYIQKTNNPTNPIE